MLPAQSDNDDADLPLPKASDKAKTGGANIP